MFESNFVKAFICTDKFLSTTEILNAYKKRWSIEVFFRETKKYFGLNDYQVRSAKSIKRYILLAMISYTFCEFTIIDDKIIFGFKKLKMLRDLIEQIKIIWTFNKVQEGKTCSEIIECRKIG